MRKCFKCVMRYKNPVLLYQGLIAVLVSHSKTDVVSPSSEINFLSF